MCTIFKSDSAGMKAVLKTSTSNSNAFSDSKTTFRTSISIFCFLSLDKHCSDTPRQLKPSWKAQDLNTWWSPPTSSKYFSEGIKFHLITCTFPKQWGQQFSVQLSCNLTYGMHLVVNEGNLWHFFPFICLPRKIKPATLAQAFRVLTPAGFYSYSSFHMGREVIDL